jgi:hypothetical protein
MADEQRSTCPACAGEPWFDGMDDHVRIADKPRLNPAAAASRHLLGLSRPGAGTSGAANWDLAAAKKRQAVKATTSGR